MATAARRPLSVSLMQLPPRPHVHREVLEFLSRANAEGLELRGQVAARPVGMVLGLSNTLNPFMTNPVFQKLIGLTPEEQGAAMREEGLRAEILAAQTREKNRGRVGGNLIHRYDLMYDLGEIPDYEPPASARISERAGIRPVELAYDIVATGGMLYLVSANYVDTTSTPSARCWCTPTPSRASLTTARTSARSATRASPLRCWRTGRATVTTT